MHGNPQRLASPAPGENPYWNSTTDIDTEQAAFLFTLANAAADNLHGYELTESMRTIRDEAGPRGNGFDLSDEDIQYLIDNGYL